MFFPSNPHLFMVKSPILIVYVSWENQRNPFKVSKNAVYIRYIPVLLPISPLSKMTISLGAKDQMFHPLVMLKVHRMGPHFDEFSQPNLGCNIHLDELMVKCLIDHLNSYNSL